MPPAPRPQLSGNLIGIVVGACFLASGLALPIAAHLPHWIEFELVLGIWWVVWWIILCFVLFHRVDVKDDAHVPQADRLRTWPFLAFGEGLVEAAGCAFSEGCLVVLGIALAFGLVVAGVLFFVELLLPGLAFLLCLAVRGMLIQASRRHAQCEGNSALSALWAMIWATAYTAPIGLIIWGIQAFLTHRPR